MSALRLMIPALRILLGVVFVYAAYVKLKDPWELFAMAVDAYNLLPQWVVIVVARTLPWAELAIGLLLMAGRLPKIAAAAASVLLGGFFALMVRAYFLGMEIECGCFGPGDPISGLTLLRDGTLLAAAVGLAVAAFRTAPAAQRSEA